MFHKRLSAAVTVSVANVKLTIIFEVVITVIQNCICGDFEIGFIVTAVGIFFGKFLIKIFDHCIYERKRWIFVGVMLVKKTMQKAVLGVWNFQLDTVLYGLSVLLLQNAANDIQILILYRIKVIINSTELCFGSIRVPDNIFNIIGAIINAYFSAFQIFRFGTFFVYQIVHTVVVLITHSVRIVRIRVEIFLGVIRILVIRKSRFVCGLPRLIYFYMFSIQHIRNFGIKALGKFVVFVHLHIKRGEICLFREFAGYITVRQFPDCFTDSVPNLVVKIRA